MLLTSLLRIYLTRSLKPFMFENKYSTVLDFENEQNLGLYAHIPFCRSLCSFCPYCKVVYNEDLAKEYKRALIREIDMVGSRLRAKRAVTSLYFGGGTPALMADSLQDIIECFNKYFIIEQGIGIELHPDDICSSILQQLKDVGVTMVSAGLQSFNQQCLSVLGRESANFLDKMELLRQADFNVVDVDLIFAVPTQTEEILIKDVETAFASGATQVSTYPFIDFTFAQNCHKPLSKKNKKKMLNAIANYCKETGKNRTSVWTFAKKNSEKYSSVTRDNYLGFGVSAVTLLHQEFKINTFSIDAYLDRIHKDQLPTSLTLSFSLRQLAVYYLFWSAYSMRISPDEFEKFMDQPLSELFGFELRLCKMLKFVEEKNNCYYLTDKGAYYYHYIEQTYTTAYVDKMWNISRLTAFPDRVILR